MSTTNISYERILQVFNRSQQKIFDMEMFPFVSVKNFDAMGDGVTDDYDAIKSAFDSLPSTGGTVVLPAGTYVISKTIVIPDRCKMVGEGKDNTKIIASTSENFSVLAPLEYTGIHSTQRYRTMVTTEMSGDNGDDTRAKYIKIEGMTIDWNNRPNKTHSIAPIMMDRTQYTVINDVEVINTIPIGDDVYDKGHGCAILFSFSDDCYCDEVTLHATPYESLSVRHLSKNIHFYNGIFDIESTAPEPQEHAFQLARPTAAAPTLESRYGETMAGPLFVENCSFYIGANVKQAGCVHQGKETFLNNNYFFVRPTANKLEFLYKPFTIFYDCTMNNNYVDMTQYSRTDHLAPVFCFEEGIGWGNRVQVKDNIIKYRLPDDFVSSDVNYPLLGGKNGGHANIQIDGNNVSIDNYPAIPFDVIGIRGTRWNVSDNIIQFINSTEEISSDTEINVIRIYGELRHGMVRGNIVDGDGHHSKTIEIEDNDRHRFIIKDNLSNRARGKAFPDLNDLPSSPSVMIKDNLSY